VDPQRGEAILPVLDAPIRVATARRAEGDRAGADSVLRDAERRFTTELERQHGRRPALDLWMRLSDARAQRGALDGSLDALRGALREPAAADEAPRLVLALAQRSLEGGRADSALVYAAWAESGFGGRARAEALMLGGRAWEARGAPDSALAAYQRFLDSYSQQPDEAAQVRFQRGQILERQGRWEQAVTEYRVLATSQPTHELGFRALLQIVGHHVSRGENDLARLEGERALDQVDRLISTQRDESIQLLARRTRGELQLAMGDDSVAFETFRDLWKRSPRTEIGSDAGLRAAALAERQHDSAKARDLYQQIESRAADPEATRKARSALDRLSSGKG
jgi:tetratricopeptide (TPR) repeat protein